MSYLLPPQSSKSQRGNFRHGHARRGRRTGEYRSWAAMKARTRHDAVPSPYHPTYANVRVCPRWERFENFIQDVGLKPSEFHSLDRYPNPAGNYEPGNCRWATDLEQVRNRLNSLVVSFENQDKALIEWSEELGLE